MWKSLQRLLRQAPKDGFRDVKSPYREFVQKNWTQYYPRKYAAPGGWCSPRLLAMERLERREGSVAHPERISRSICLEMVS